jgi:endonuclease/exonuclease/phosphatase family metal-dependent hydrolase
VYVRRVIRLRVLTWNLFHGRAAPSSGPGFPGSGRDLSAEFCAALAGWEWDVALLQEVPPWWPARLAAELGCEQRTVLTSRNALLGLRRRIAERAPDLIKSNGGGANAILARDDRIVDDRAQRLCRWPERRWVHGVALACGVWVGNLHLTAGRPAAARRDLDEAARATRAWARERQLPIVLGGDFNLRTVTPDGLTAVATRDVDHVLIGDGVRALGEAERLQRGRLSDHVPLAVDLAVEPR